MTNRQQIPKTSIKNKEKVIDKSMKNLKKSLKSSKMVSQASNGILWAVLRVCLGSLTNYTHFSDEFLKFKAAESDQTASFSCR